MSLKNSLFTGLAAIVMGCSPITEPLVEEQDYSFTFTIRTSYFTQVKGRVNRIIESRGEVFNEGVNDLYLKPHIKFYASKEDKDLNNYFYETTGYLGSDLGFKKSDLNGIPITYFALTDTIDTLMAGESLHHLITTDTLHQKGLLYWRFKFVNELGVGKSMVNKDYVEGVIKR